MRKQDLVYFDDLTDARLFGLNIERESGAEPYDGKVAVGTVTLERVDHRDWDGKTLREVILKPWQFSWTMPEAGREYYEEAVRIAQNYDVALQGKLKSKDGKNVIAGSLRECLAIANGMIDGSVPRDPDLAAVNCCQYVASKYRKYMDNHPEKPCTRWWQKGKLIKIIGGHEFYTER